MEKGTIGSDAAKRKAECRDPLLDGYRAYAVGSVILGPAITLLMLPCVALLSMYLIERPFIRLPRRLSRSITTSSLPLHI